MILFLSFLVGHLAKRTGRSVTVRIARLQPIFVDRFSAAFAVGIIGSGQRG